jgi:hypothetical protein
LPQLWHSNSVPPSGISGLRGDANGSCVPLAILLMWVCVNSLLQSGQVTIQRGGIVRQNTAFCLSNSIQESIEPLPPTQFFEREATPCERSAPFGSGTSRNTCDSNSLSRCLSAEDEARAFINSVFAAIWTFDLSPAEWEIGFLRPQETQTISVLNRGMYKRRCAIGAR